MTDHPLKVWLEENDEPAYFFADRIGLSRSFIYGVLNLKFRNIGIEEAARIEIGTNGKVTAQTLFNYLYDHGLLKGAKHE